jgi:hypothetical protein
MDTILKRIAIAIIVLFLGVGTVFAASVVFNTKTYKYHSLDCRWAQKCTQNCIKIEKEKAIKRGGIPCKVCGG